MPMDGCVVGGSLVSSGGREADLMIAVYDVAEVWRSDRRSLRFICL